MKTVEKEKVAGSEGAEGRCSQLGEDGAGAGTFSYLACRRIRRSFGWAKYRRD